MTEYKKNNSFLLSINLKTLINYANQRKNTNFVIVGLDPEYFKSI